MMNLKQKYFIDTHKGITPFFIILMLYCFDAWNNVEAIIYLALHGSYGILWVTKSCLFPDRQWEQNTPIWYGFGIWFFLSLYWISPYVICSGSHFFPFHIHESFNAIFIGLCVILYIFGIFLHFTSDMQKYTSLKLNPGNLITTEMFLRSRNTNYLGEFFIYLGFILISKDYLPLLALFTIIIFVWVPNMIKKDKSLSRYNDFPKYKKQSKSFFPFFF